MAYQAVVMRDCEFEHHHGKKRSGTLMMIMTPELLKELRGNTCPKPDEADASSRKDQDR